MKKIRDLSILSLGGGESLIIACDSIGGIGSKDRDTVKVKGNIVGRFAARVPLLEVIASGASPIALVNTLTVEMHPSGKDILKGIIEELEDAMLAGLTVVTGSSEENVPTCQTGVGVTVIGRARKDIIRLGTSCPGDKLYCLGVPRVGEEVLKERFIGSGSSFPTIFLLKELLSLREVREVLPVGSRGIAYEAGELASSSNLMFNWIDEVPLDLKKSAGPATCLLVSTVGDVKENPFKNQRLPVTFLGTLDRIS